MADLRSQQVRQRQHGRQVGSLKNTTIDYAMAYDNHDNGEEDSKHGFGIASVGEPLTTTRQSQMAGAGKKGRLRRLQRSAAGCSDPLRAHEAVFLAGAALEEHVRAKARERQTATRARDGQRVGDHIGADYLPAPIGNTRDIVDRYSETRGESRS